MELTFVIELFTVLPLEILVKENYLLFFLIFFLGVILFLLEIYKRQLHQKNIYLISRQKLLDKHYEAIGLQVVEIRKAQQQMNEDMDLIIKMDAETKDVNVHVADYLTGLKEQTITAKAGIYCDDWIVDSILYHNELVCKELGIDVEYDFSRFYRGKISNEDITKIFICLFNSVIKFMGKYSHKSKSKKISVNAITVKGKLIIRVVCNSNGKKLKVKHMEYYIKRYEGYLKQVVNEQGEYKQADVQVSLRVG